MTTIASLTALVLGGLCAWWAAPKAPKGSNTPAPASNQLARLEQRFLHVRDATMRLNETALQREKLDEQNQSLAQLTRIKEGVQLLLDALERNMVRHHECTPEQVRTLERQLSDTSKALRDVLDLERHPEQPSEDWVPKLNRIEETLSKYAGINPIEQIDIESDALTNLDRLFQPSTSAQEA
jgi:hypothetical protein